MTELYLIFSLVGFALFMGIVGYSYFQQKKGRDGEEHGGRTDRSDALDAGYQNETKEEALKKQSIVKTKSALAALKRRSRRKQNAKNQSKGKTHKEGSSRRSDSNKKANIQKTSDSKESVAAPAPDKQTNTDSNGQGVAENESSPILIANDKVVTDLVAKVNNPDPISQNELLVLFREHDFKFHRKVHIYGLNELTDMWRDVEFELPSARFLELGISIQLCDREGAMTEKELHDFQQMVYQFCERYDAPFEFSMAIDDALKQAQTLDQLGRRYDSMAVLNVVPKSKSGFRIADIQSCARDLMLSTDKNGIFMKTEGQKNNITVLYRLACTDGQGHFGVQSGLSPSSSVNDLVVYMNVPSTPDPENVFQQMVKDANDLATWLDGKVVDRNGRGMTQRSYATLMQQISDIAFSMQQEGLTPGDVVTKKLF